MIPLSRIDSHLRNFLPSASPDAIRVLHQLLAAPGGTTASQAGAALGKSRASAKRYLSALRGQGVAELTGGGRGSRWRLARTESPAAPEQSAGPPVPRSYLTLATHAEAVVKGVAGDVDAEQRAVMEQVYDMTHGG